MKIIKGNYGSVAAQEKLVLDSMWAVLTAMGFP
jgi:hypothetical protein